MDEKIAQDQNRDVLLFAAAAASISAAVLSLKCTSRQTFDIITDMEKSAMIDNLLNIRAEIEQLAKARD